MKRAEMELISELFSQKEIIEDFLKTFHSNCSLKNSEVSKFNVSINLADSYGNTLGTLFLNDRDAKETIECIESRLGLINRELEGLSVWGLDYLPESLKPLEADNEEENCSEEGGEN